MIFTNDPLFVPLRWLLGRLRPLKVVETLSENTFGLYFCKYMANSNQTWLEWWMLGSVLSIYFWFHLIEQDGRQRLS